MDGTAPEAAPARFNNYGHEWRSQPCMMGIGECETGRGGALGRGARAFGGAGAQRLVCVRVSVVSRVV